MKLSTATTLLLLTSATTAFTPAARPSHSATALAGYLDNLSAELHGEDPNPKPEEETREATNLNKEDVDRFGVGSWDDFKDFEEFDGGDGQMGVAGDGSKGLEKEWAGAAEMGKSKSMSAKNAWGKSTGYAEELIDQGVEATRAQQLENWRNQQEVLHARNEQKQLVETFDQPDADEDWRTLSKFGVERTQVRYILDYPLFTWGLVTLHV